MTINLGYDRPEQSQNVRAFLDDLMRLYDKHGMSIGHEDGHGAFLIDPDGKHNRDWMVCAFDEVVKNDTE